MSAVCYLKILLVFLVLSSRSNTGPGVADAGTIAKYADAVTKRILMAKSLPFEDCGSRYLILYLGISSCNTIPCVMHRGSKVQVNVIFDDDGKNTSFLKHQVRWIFNAINTEAHITPDPCDGFDECITNDKDAQSYWATVLVNDTLPGQSGTMKWDAVNEYNQNVLCFKVPVTLTTQKL